MYLRRKTNTINDINKNAAIAKNKITIIIRKLIEKMELIWHLIEMYCSSSRILEPNNLIPNTILGNSPFNFLFTDIKNALNICLHSSPLPTINVSNYF
jgi:hypothetical protein